MEHDADDHATGGRDPPAAVNVVAVERVAVVPGGEDAFPGVRQLLHGSMATVVPPRLGRRC